MEFLDERGARRVIRREMARSSRADLVVAFWGHGAGDRLGISDRPPEGVRIVCNLTMGGTNPSEIKHLQERGFDVRHCDGLHAKVYIFDDAVLIGSSNASSNGLSFQDGERSGWLEANIFSRDPSLIRKARKWSTGLQTKLIGDGEIAAAEDAWRKRRQAMPAENAASILDMIVSNPTFFEGREVYAVFFSQNMDEEGENGMDEARDQLGPEVCGYQDWPELPKEAKLVSFRLGSKGGLIEDGLAERRKMPPDRPLPSGRELQICWPLDDIYGLSVPPRDLPLWKAICKRFRESGDVRWDRTERCGILNLNDVAGFMPR